MAETSDKISLYNSDLSSSIETFDNDFSLGSLSSNFFKGDDSFKGVLAFETFFD